MQNGKVGWRRWDAGGEDGQGEVGFWLWEPLLGMLEARPGELR